MTQVSRGPARQDVAGGRRGSTAAGADLHALVIDEELEALIPRLSPEELAQLEQNLLAEGCREKLIAWDDGRKKYLVDGHNRLGICKRHRLPFDVEYISLPDREAAIQWILKHQLGRRNLSPEAMSYLRGRMYLGAKRQGARTDLTSGHSAQKSTTAEQLATQYKVDEKTIRRDAQFAELLDQFAEACGPQIKNEVLARDARITRKDVPRLLALEKSSREQVVAGIRGGAKASVLLRELGSRGANDTLREGEKPDNGRAGMSAALEHLDIALRLLGGLPPGSGSAEGLVRLDARMQHLQKEAERHRAALQHPKGARVDVVAAVQPVRDVASKRSSNALPMTAKRERHQDALQDPNTPRVDVLAAVQTVFEFEMEGILKAPPVTATDIIFADPTDPKGLDKQLADVRERIERRAANRPRPLKHRRHVAPANALVDHAEGTRPLSYKTFSTIQRYLGKHLPVLMQLSSEYAATRAENPEHARVCEKIDRFIENGGSEIVDDSFSYVDYIKARCPDPQVFHEAARAMGQEIVAYLRALNQFSDKVLHSVGHSTMKQGSAPVAAPGHVSRISFTQSPKQPKGALAPAPNTQDLLSRASAPAANTQALLPSIPVSVTVSATPEKPRECPTDERIEEEVSQLIDDLQSGRLRHSFEAEKAIRQKNWPQTEKDKALQSFFKRRGKLPPSGRTTMPSQSLPSDSTVPAAGSAPTSASLTPPASHQPCCKDVETGVLSRAAALLESAPPDVLQQAMRLASAVR